MSAALTVGGLALLLAARVELRRKVLLRAWTGESRELRVVARDALHGASQEVQRAGLKACGVAEEDVPSLLEYLSAITRGRRA